MVDTKSKEQFVLALDQGTTSSRAILFDRSTRIVASDAHEFPQHFPAPGWVEHNADEIWDSQVRAMSGALEKARATAWFAGKVQGVVVQITKEIGPSPARPST